jgi:formamidopyrimidine-DNA glycosylase
LATISGWFSIGFLGRYVIDKSRDEILYHAKLHPEQYSDTFSATQLKQLHTSILHVCQTAVDVLGDSTKFPAEWLFNHRWGKGKKDTPGALPNGAKITFLTVGGRTSCVVPSVQKKTGPVAGEVKPEDDARGAVGGKKKGEEAKGSAGGRGKRKAADEETEGESVDEKKRKPRRK